jgi:hypothetical protein
VLVLTDGEDTVRDRQIFSGEYGDDAGKLKSLRRVDLFNERVRLRRAQHLAVEHPRQRDVVREQGLPRTLRARVHLAEGLTDDLEIFAAAAAIIV